MSIMVKHYPQDRICDEFYQVIRFLEKYGVKGHQKNWHWARWEWLLGHLSLDESTLPDIGLFMEHGELVGLVTHDMRAPAYILAAPRRADILPRMVEYAAKHLSRNGVSCIYVDEKDETLTAVVREKGYERTDDRECVLAFDCEKPLDYCLEERFHFTDYASDKNIDAYSKVIHEGFENDGEPARLTEADIPLKPHFDPRLTVFAAAANGEYAAHCGMWYTPDTAVCYVEPVVTVPGLRKYGLGKAVVYEGIRRCAGMGAKQAIVISDQAFYHRIGFTEYASFRLWTRQQERQG